MTTSSDTLETTVRELGYTDVRQFARVQAMNLLNRRIHEHEAIVQAFERKYQTDWSTFQVAPKRHLLALSNANTTRWPGRLP
ncbi:hypothetical protein GCM10023189_17420 [Nibrella saemangeumensis]|uniref:Uncharacterized protein n=1 Tax=Nibrella saemangeumensis TaxID=1084526 RepID=A0ABP8MP13_9BACT